MQSRQRTVLIAVAGLAGAAFGGMAAWLLLRRAAKESAPSVAEETASKARQIGWRELMPIALGVATLVRRITDLARGEEEEREE